MKMFSSLNIHFESLSYSKIDICHLLGQLLNYPFLWNYDDAHEALQLFHHCTECQPF